ncbi:MAG: GNAT family N-acetyltransferase [Oscillospiraceae bacterium]|nr:GNAT family N-acetyltransferase [Oscillospiraceae bacterium]
MFVDIKAEMNTPTVRKIIAYAALDGSPAGVAKEVQTYQQSPALNFYAWVEDGTVIGICGYEIHEDHIEVHLISVDKQARGRRVGSAIIKALRDRYRQEIRLETVDEAVGFYQKIGFMTREFPDPTFNRKYRCTLMP